MYLKSLTLKGFKSFADRSVLSLEPGITAIVGPNGSGKSNISDAVLWVLGERSAKNLRGQVMDDIIFSGSASRRAVNVAEVELVLDNSDGHIAVDYTEIVLTRRLYRNGESDYLINGSLARRMDFMDILHDSGLGSGVHSIISQGNLDYILESKPEDRRALVEEAAGVLKHKQRKERSRSKLEQMEQHLARAKDIVAEVERQLVPLERKAKRALTYQEVMGELSDLTLQLAVDDVRRLRERWGQITADEALITQTIAQNETAIQAADAEVERLQELIQQEGSDAYDLSRKLRRIEAASERFDSYTMIFREKADSTHARNEELRIQVDAFSARNESLTHETSELKGALGALGEQRDAAAELVSNAEEKSRQASEARAQSEASIAALSTEKAMAEKQREQLKRELDAKRDEHAKAESQKMVAVQRLADAEERIAAGSQRLQGLSAAIDVSDAELAAGNEAQDRMQRELDDMKASLDGQRSAAEALRAEAGKLAAKAAALEELERAAVEALSPAQLWLQGNRERFGVESLPTLVQIIRPHEGYEAIVDSLLADETAALYIGDADAGRIAAAFDETGLTGQMALLAAPPAGSRTVSSGTDRLIDHVDIADGYAALVESLLGDVIMCADYAHAAKARKAAPTLRYATTGGLILWPNGLVTLGYKDSALANPISRGKQLAETNASYAETSAALDAANARIDELEAAVRERQAESLRHASDLAAKQGSHIALVSEQAQLRDELDALAESVERLRGDASQDDAAADIHAAYASIGERIASLDQRIGELQAGLESEQETLSGLRSSEAAALATLAEKRTSLATLDERIRFTTESFKRASEETEQLGLSALIDTQEILRNEVREKRYREMSDAFSQLATVSRNYVKSLEAKAQESINASDRMNAEASIARQRSREARDAYNDATQRLADVRVEKGTLELRLQTVIATIEDECATPLDTALEMPALEDRPAAEEQAARLKRRVQSMGTINPDAADEFKAVKERYDFLVGQLEDLQSARAELRTIDSLIEERMRRDFIETFAQVNENFKEIFSVLFPGGKAELVLENPDDEEASGVEVIAQPAGKRVAKMMLLSGGEKSLTALALLFAIYRIRSAPFYIFDEVEAALDDANLRRFISYIDYLRETTQIILITHQRRSMESADVLFGVSMQQDGVSKVISQRLDKKKE